MCWTRLKAFSLLSALLLLSSWPLYSNEGNSCLPLLTECAERLEIAINDRENLTATIVEYRSLTNELSETISEYQILANEQQATLKQREATLTQIEASLNELERTSERERIKTMFSAGGIGFGIGIGAGAAGALYLLNVMR